MSGADWFEREFDETRVYKLDLGVYVFTIFYSLIFLLLTIYKLWFGKPSKIIYKSIRILSTLHVLFYLAYFIAFYPKKRVNRAATNRIISYIMLMCAQLSFYILMTLRLFQTFDNTIYAISSLTIYLLTILGIFLFCSWIIWFSQSIFIDQSVSVSFNFIVLSLILGLSCLYGFTLITLFVHKLFKLTLSQKTSLDIFISKRMTSSLSCTHSKSFGGANYTNYANYGNGKNIELNEKQKSLLSTMIKNSILGIIGIVLYQFIFFIGPIIIQNYRLAVIYKFIFALAIFFEILCIYLSFKANDGCYICLCGKCHNLWQLCCQHIVERKMEKINMIQTNKILLEEDQEILYEFNDDSLFCR